MKPVTCPMPVYRQLIDLALTGAPQEVCGLLFGHRRHITHAVPLPNIAVEPCTTYQIDGQAVTRTLRQQYRSGFEWVAVFHSHPQGEAALSLADRAVAVAYPGVWQLLILPTECRLYRVTHDGVTQLPLDIVP